MTTLHRSALAGLFVTLLAAAPSLADHNRHAGLYWLAGEIRGQIAEVQARAKVVLPFCDDADDIRDELAQLARDLTRFEQRLSKGVRDGHDLDRLARLAERVHEHACELKEELADALEDLRDDHRIQQFHRNGLSRPIHQRHVARGRAPVQYVDLDLDDLEDRFEDRREAIEELREERREAIEEYYDDLEDRFDDFDDDDFRRRRIAPRGRAIYSYPQPYYLQSTSRHAYRWGGKRRGVRVSVGRFGPIVTFSSGGVKVAPPVPAVRPLPPPPVVVAPPAPIGLPWQQVDELKCSVDRLHQLTLQLHTVLCG